MTMKIPTLRNVVDLARILFGPAPPAHVLASAGGTAADYKHAAVTGLDGRRLQRHDGSGPVKITHVAVSADSTEGKVVCLFSTGDGPSDRIDVETASANIEGIARGTLTEPVGVVPDCVTFVGMGGHT